MRLILFDLDGTLTQTLQVDIACFVQALADIFQITAVSTDWSDYPHITHSGLLHEVCHRRLGRGPSTTEYHQFQQHFCALLGPALAATPQAGQPVAGAAQMLAWLQRTPGYGWALATGGWRAGAEVKLRTAALPFEGIPAAFADDAHAREAIMEWAVHRAAQHYGCPRFDSIIFIGDSRHDVWAAQHLGYPFIGIGSGPRVGRLREAGATDILPDFVDIERFWAVLERAGQKA